MLLEDAWIKAGGAKENIYFAFMPSHPISTPDDKKLVSYRQAAKELAASLPNASCIMLPELAPQKTMLKGLRIRPIRPFFCFGVTVGPMSGSARRTTSSWNSVLVWSALPFLPRSHDGCRER